MGNGPRSLSYTLSMSTYSNFLFYRVIYLPVALSLAVVVVSVAFSHFFELLELLEVVVRDRAVSLELEN